MLVVDTESYVLYHSCFKSGEGLADGALLQKRDAELSLLGLQWLMSITTNGVRGLDTHHRPFVQMITGYVHVVEVNN